MDYLVGALTKEWLGDAVALGSKRAQRPTLHPE